MSFSEAVVSLACRMNRLLSRALTVSQVEKRCRGRKHLHGQLLRRRRSSTKHGRPLRARCWRRSSASLARRIVEGEVLHCYFMSVDLCSRYSRKAVCPWVGKEKEIEDGSTPRPRRLVLMLRRISVEWSSSHAESHLRLTAWGLVASRRGAGFVIAEVRHFR